MRTSHSQIRLCKLISIDTSVNNIDIINFQTSCQTSHPPTSWYCWQTVEQMVQLHTYTLSHAYFNASTTIIMASPKNPGSNIFIYLFCFFILLFFSQIKEVVWNLTLPHINMCSSWEEWVSYSTTFYRTQLSNSKGFLYLDNLHIHT